MRTRCYQTHRVFACAGALTLAALLVVSAASAATRQSNRPARRSSEPAPTKASARATPGRQRVVREGVAVELQVEPRGLDAGGRTATLTEDEDAVLKFKVTDTRTGRPLSGLNLSAWMSRRGTDEAAGAAQCREKVQAFVQGSLRARPDVDLNAYYVLALNAEPNISVIDPLLGFGGSKLLALVPLRSAGLDWALTSDRRRLFVSMPLVNQVAVVDTASWKVLANVDTGVRPTRVRLQPNERYLWVGTDGASGGETTGVTVIDALEPRRAADIRTGAGHHELAFSPDSRHAYVTNQQDGTVSVVDVAKLAKEKDIALGAAPVSAEWSSLARALYVGAEDDGSISVVDGERRVLLTRVMTKPGLRSVRFAPGGRYGFAVNPRENAVIIFDASTNQVLHEISVGRSPDQVAFTNAFAYVHSAGSEQINAIRLATVGKELDLTHFPAGVRPPGSLQGAAAADLVVPAPEGNAVLVANPSDRQLYYYAEGMAAPMGNFQNYKRVPRAVTVIDRSLREESRGVYATNIKLPRGGTYDVSFLLDSPRIVHCFEAEVRPNPALKLERRAALGIEYLDAGRELRVGEPYKLRFKLTDPATGRPKDALEDVRVLFLLTPGVWQRRDFAKSVGGGVYEFDVNAPEDGVYMVFVESASQGVSFRQLPYLTLRASAASPAPTQKTR